MSPRAKATPDVEVVSVEESGVEKMLNDVHTPEEVKVALLRGQAQEEAAKAKEAPEGVEEFNNHIKDLVRLFFESEVQGLEERIRDLERLVTQILGVVGVPSDDPSAAPYRPAADTTPDYASEHRSGDGVPWYAG